MASGILRSRVVSFLTKRNLNRNQRALCSNYAANTRNEAVVDSASSASAAAQTGSNEAAASTADAKSRSKAWSFLKYSLIGLFTGATATAGYVSSAYSLDEIEKRAKSIREAADYRPSEDASSVDKFQGLFDSAAMKGQGLLYSAATQVINSYLDARRFVEEEIRNYTEPHSDKLLPDLDPQYKHLCTLVLDLNETLIHYTWSRDTGWRTFKRPGVDAFLEHLAQFYEIVVYTDEQQMFVDPVLDRLDPKRCVQRLSRSATKYQNGKHYRDLSKLNRDPGKVLYLSGHAFESCLQPENCVPIKPWVQTDANDTALLDFIPFLEYVARSFPSDIRPVLASYRGYDIPSEFIERKKNIKPPKSKPITFWRS